MWGSVWETSHYFEHAVYKRNMPKRGIPVDTRSVFDVTDTLGGPGQGEKTWRTSVVTKTMIEKGRMAWFGCENEHSVHV